jgi:transposase
MSLRLPQPVPPVPDDTARIARAAFPRGNPYLLLRDRLGPVFDDTSRTPRRATLGALL